MTLSLVNSWFSLTLGLSLLAITQTACQPSGSSNGSEAKDGNSKYGGDETLNSGSIMALVDQECGDFSKDDLAKAGINTPTDATLKIQQSFGDKLFLSLGFRQGKFEEGNLAPVLFVSQDLLEKVCQGSLWKTAHGGKTRACTTELQYPSFFNNSALGQEVIEEYLDTNVPYYDVEVKRTLSRSDREERISAALEIANAKSASEEEAEGMEENENYAIQQIFIEDNVESARRHFLKHFNYFYFSYIGPQMESFSNNKDASLETLRNFLNIREKLAQLYVAGVEEAGKMDATKAAFKEQNINVSVDDQDFQTFIATSVAEAKLCSKSSKEALQEMSWLKEASGYFDKKYNAIRGKK